MTYIVYTVTENGKCWFWGSSVRGLLGKKFLFKTYF